jgi:hypothetical protein
MEKEFAEKAISIAKQHNMSKFLVDVRGTQNVASTLEQYIFGYQNMLQFGLPKDSDISILANADNESHSFIETLLINAGYHCRLFRDEEAALEWLRE